MIQLTRLNGEAIRVNAFQIETMEPAPDTRLTMASGRQIYVRETPDGVAAAVAAWWRDAVHGGGQTVHDPAPGDQADKGA